MDEVNLFSLFFSIRGISLLIGSGAIGIQHKIICEQKDKINAYEDHVSDIEILLRTIIERQDVPPDIKDLSQETIRKLKSKEE